MVSAVALWTLAGNDRPRNKRRPTLAGVRTMFDSDWCETARGEQLSGEFDVKQPGMRGLRSTIAAMRKEELGFRFHTATT